MKIQKYAQKGYNLLARAAGSEAANAAMEKLKDPGGGNSLSPGDIKNGGPEWLCIFPSISSSCDWLKWYFNLFVHSYPLPEI